MSYWQWHRAHGQGSRAGQSGAASVVTPGSVIPSFRPEHDAILLLLAFAGASVDAISYLALGRVFTANMTGNSVLFGLALVQGHGQDAIRSGVVLLGYVLGSALAALLLQSRVWHSRRPVAATAPASPDGDGQPAAGPASARGERAAPPVFVTPALVAELILLLLLAATWYRSGSPPHPGAEYLLVVLSAMAMGTQGETVQRLGVRNVSTTYITGMVTALTAGTVTWLRQLETHPGTGARGPGLPALTWLCYAAGVVASAFTVTRWHVLAISLPIVAVAAVIGLGSASGKSGA